MVGALGVYVWVEIVAKVLSFEIITTILKFEGPLKLGSFWCATQKRKKKKEKRKMKKEKRKMQKKKKKYPSDVGLIVFLSPNIRDSINIIIFRFLWKFDLRNEMLTPNMCLCMTD